MITKNTKIIDIIKQKPEANEIMLDAGLHCMGCGGASFESLQDGASAHGMSKKDIDELIEKINKSKS